MLLDSKNTLKTLSIIIHILKQIIMYIIINKTQNKTMYKKGNFPSMYEELERGDDIIIVSLYSNTIKIPYIDHSQNGYGENIWEWKEYKMELLNYLNRIKTI